MKEIFIFSLLLITLVNIISAFEETTSITSVQRHQTGTFHCVLQTPSGQRKVRSLSLCNFADKIINIQIVITSEKHQDSGSSRINEWFLVQSIQFANKNTKWYNRKNVVSTNEYPLNGQIDNIIAYNDELYISINDKNEKNGNSHKFHKVNGNDICERSLEYFLKNEHVAAIARYNPNTPKTNDIISVQPINDAIKHFFKRNCLRGNNLRTKRNLEISGMDMAILMAMYADLSNVIVEKSEPNDTHPISELAYIKVRSNNKQIKIPVYVIARIPSNRKKNNRIDLNNNRNVASHMEAMGKLDGDEIGHVISLSLGGSNDLLNLVPQARESNRHISQGTEDVPLNPNTNPNSLTFRQNLREMRYPLSVWRSNEQFIEQFLNNNRGAHVAYTIAIQYNELVTFPSDTNFQPQYLRPTHFMQQFTTVYANGTTNVIDPITTLNDREYQCSHIEPILKKRKLN